MNQTSGEPEMPKDDFITVVFKCPAVSLEDEISRVEKLENLELETQ